MYFVTVVFVTTVLCVSQVICYPGINNFNYEEQLESIVNEMTDCMAEKLYPIYSKVDDMSEDDIRSMGREAIELYVRHLSSLAMANEVFEAFHEGQDYHEEEEYHEVEEYRVHDEEEYHEGDEYHGHEEDEYHEGDEYHGHEGEELDEGDENKENYDNVKATLPIHATYFQ